MIRESKELKKMMQYLFITELTKINAIMIMKNARTRKQNRIYSKQQFLLRLKTEWKHTQILI